MPCCVTLGDCLKDKDLLPDIDYEPHVSDENRCNAICDQIVHWFGFKCMPLLYHILAWGLAISKFVIGGLFLHDCSVEPKLPVYLIVSAFVPLALYLCCRCMCCEELIFTVLSTALIVFMMAWLSAGTAFYVMARDTMASCQETTVTGSPSTLATTTATWPHPNITTPDIPHPTQVSTVMMTSDITSRDSWNTTEPRSDDTCTCDATLLVFTLVTIVIEWSVNVLYCLVFPWAVLAGCAVEEY